MIFVFIRLIAFFSCLSVIFPSGTPNVFKVTFTLFISIIISCTLKVHIEVSNTYDLINIAVMETITGLVLGYITSICINSLKIAGSLIDQQLGLSMVNIYDPNSKDNTTLIENMVYWIGIMVFFTMNGHHKLIAGISQSFKLVNVGSPILTNNYGYIVNIFIQCFVIGFKIAVPIILALIITDFIMGLISRSVPQLNVMIIGMPLKILVGIMFFVISLPFILNELHNLLVHMTDILNGTFMSCHSSYFTAMAPLGAMLSTDDKTEEPSSKKIKDARKSGNVAKSKEVVTTLTLLGVLIIIYSMSDFVILQLKESIVRYLNMGFSNEFSMKIVGSLLMMILAGFMKIIVPIGVIIIVFSVIGNVMQSGFLMTTDPLKPKFSKLNPINGFKNMFSMKSLGNLIKSIILVAILFKVGYSFMSKNFIGILKTGDIYLPYLMSTIITLIKELIQSILLALFVISVVDFAYQKYMHKKDLKMTKQEVKEEYKQMEGNPEIKGKIKQKQREMASRRMMEAVPSASVIVTNPTHISIAIKYEKGKDQAPIVVAKGADIVAFKIREIAKEHDIPIIENKPLARLMYKEVEIEEEIPEKVYQEVAEVLVAVYKIKNRYKKL
ncbi:fused FliR family export protein/FlhB family type III secretion system protein [Paraclostridium sordellii]|uniref:fused FliR family export protein/FlhB family type III secretion system protein n=1 Tax=Paraclostridium sordellii TaxID=1505 RepID=UPI0005E5E6C3|nr:fused FliR family export protein/FlhB family type III secretion system protein [Paeniclostridium sordellii]QYE97270.1 fused FliR family export protein/FlhB family type III secretion system protein [Paeniclostridium sordellii]CEN21619.1 bifunctional flagellar biosynthesis protein FliR/FlhB [[Clostridium] sordellii] [Paeniclostridium sordellii]CEP88187.1 bifunctional flagellar biosynthesis protein FliR/FlhB [[Clostridium] sordellii] [Paeniclostridium sordellii]CEQ00806.1 bifunctional flagellar